MTGAMSVHGAAEIGCPVGVFIDVIRRQSTNWEHRSQHWAEVVGRIVLGIQDNVDRTWHAWPMKCGSMIRVLRMTAGEQNQGKKRA